MSDWVHLEDVEILKETEKAFLVDLDGEEYWLPKSQILDADEYREGDEGTLSISAWIAREKGLS